MIISYNNDSIFVGDGGVTWQEGLPTLLMLHGAGLDHTVWVLLGRYFARHGYNVVIPDLPGHGASDGELLSSIEDCATWLNGVPEELAKSHPLETQKMIYVGHSMGSLVTLQAAAAGLNTPDHLSNLLLLGSASPMVVGDPLLDAAKANDHAAIDMINMFGHGFGSRIGNNKVSGINIYNTMEALLERAEPGVLFNDLSACNNYKTGDAAADALAGRVRTTVIAGELDRMTPAKMAVALCKRLEATMHMLDDCGHMMMSEKPEETLQAMLQALSGNSV